jgi:hypothetical protein
MKRTPALLAALLLAPLAALHAADLSLSDPANVEKPPAWAVGQADRSINLDVLPGFQKPPPGFGNVPFYWWLGDPLTKERLSWQLDQLETPISPPSGLRRGYDRQAGPPQWLFQGSPAESKFLAAPQAREITASFILPASQPKPEIVLNSPLLVRHVLAIPLLTVFAR